MEEYCITNEEEISKIRSWSLNKYRITDSVTGDLYVDPVACTVYRDVGNKHEVFVKLDQQSGHLVMVLMMSNMAQLLDKEV